MTRDDIIRLAREAGLLPHPENIVYQDPMFEGRIKTFAALVAAAERERNDAYIKSLHESVSWQAERVIACLKALEKAVLAEREACAELIEDMAVQHPKYIAAAIRARGQG